MCKLFADSWKIFRHWHKYLLKCTIFIIFCEIDIIYNLYLKSCILCVNQSLDRSENGMHNMHAHYISDVFHANMANKRQQWLCPWWMTLRYVPDMIMDENTYLHLHIAYYALPRPYIDSGLFCAQ